LGNLSSTNSVIIVCIGGAFALGMLCVAAYRYRKKHALDAKEMSAVVGATPFHKWLNVYSEPTPQPQPPVIVKSASQDSLDLVAVEFEQIYDTYLPETHSITGSTPSSQDSKKTAPDDSHPTLRPSEHGMEDVFEVSHEADGLNVQAFGDSDRLMTQVNPLLSGSSRSARGDRLAGTSLSSRAEQDDSEESLTRVYFFTSSESNSQNAGHDVPSRQLNPLHSVRLSRTSTGLTSFPRPIGTSATSNAVESSQASIKAAVTRAKIAQIQQARRANHLALTNPMLARRPLSATPQKMPQRKSVQPAQQPQQSQQSQQSHGTESMQMTQPNPPPVGT